VTLQPQARPHPVYPVFSVLAGCKADVLVTGEMSHHEVLDFVHK
jgi:hypothetical protein